jgi:hypothetical protein
MTKNKLKIIFLFAVLFVLLLSSNVASASEMEGVLNTGINGGTVASVEGVVVSIPLASPAPQIYTSAQNVTLILPAQAQANSIRYTIDGSLPTCSTGILYSGTITVGSTETIKAISCYTQNHSSPVASYTYTINIPVPVNNNMNNNVGGGGGGTFIPFIAPIVPTTPRVIPGCNSRTTGFSVTTGQSCVGNIGTTPVVGQVLGAQVFHFTLSLKKGAKGNEVMELQKFLNAAGYDSGKADGKFGAKVKAALIKFQIAKKLKGDGVVGPKVRTLLNK